MRAQWEAPALCCGEDADEERPSDGGPGVLRLTRKADVDSHTRLITSIYLPEQEFALRAATLQGSRIEKIRHRLHAAPGVLLSVDEFLGEHRGLLLAEAEFESPEELAAFPTPTFAAREVTDDPRYTGVALATRGLPPNLDAPTDTGSAA